MDDQDRRKTQAPSSDAVATSQKAEPSIEEYLDSLSSAQIIRMNELIRQSSGWSKGYRVRITDRNNYVQARGTDAVAEQLKDYDPTGKRFPRDFTFQEKRAIEAQARLDGGNEPFHVTRFTEACHHVAAEPGRVAEAIKNEKANRERILARVYSFKA